MNQLHRATLLALGICGLMLAPAARAGIESAEGLTKQIPGDLPVCVVIADFEKLDKTIKQWGKRIAPDEPESSPLDELRAQVSVADWVDFTKPFAFGAINPTGGGEPAMWVNVPGFAEKIAKYEGAKKVEDHWEAPKKDEPSTMLFIKELDGGFVVVAPSADELTKATAKGPSLAEGFKARADIFKDRDFAMHLEMKHFREQATGGLTQMGMMVPMLAMAAAGQGGDPASAMSIQAMASALLETSKKFVEQLGYLDIAGGMDGQEANITLATGFVDGPIKSYLVSAKPASAPLLTTIEDQPYFIAMGTHVPGGMSAITEYFTKRMEDSMRATGQPAATPPAGDKPAGDKPAEGAPGEKPAEPAKNPMADSLKLSMEMNALTEGVSLVMSVQKDGMKMTGDALVKDAGKYMDLLKKSLTSNSEMTKAFGGGASYEMLGATKIGDVNVEQFSLKLDEKKAAGMGQGGPELSKLLGANTRYGAGAVDGHVRFCMGSEADMQKSFAKTAEKPFAGGKHVEAALKKLPEKRNGVVLIDLAGMAQIMEMFGRPMSNPLPPGAPFAASFSVAGEPARVDINIPLKAIERAVQAFSPQQPM